MRAVGGKTPAHVDSPWPESESAVTTTMSQMESVTRNDQPRLKAECLLQGGGHCVLSGRPDWRTNPRDGARTECAHTTPFGLGEVSGDVKLVNLLSTV